MSNRTGRYDQRPGAALPNSDNRFAYDGLHRLTIEDIGRDADGPSTGITWDPTLNSKQWTLDLLGNWTRLAFDANGDGDFGDSGVDQAEDRTHNNANEIEVRELADELPTPAGPALDSAYDDAGNTRTILDASDDGVRYTHDAWNRLVRVQAVDAGSSFADVAEYEYNGLHWRTLRDNGVDERDLFYYSSDWQLLEEHRYEYESLPGTLTRVAQQFWGLRYIDDAIARRIDGNADGDYLDTETLSNPDGTWFSLTDVQFSVVAVLDDLKVLTERVRYDAYGRARHRWPMDLDGDGDADNDDYFDQLAAASTSIHGTNYNPDADHDRDGDVDNNDFSTFLLGAGRAALTYGLISDAVAGPDNPIGYDGYVFAPEAGIVVGSGGAQPQAAGAYCVRFRWYLPETGRWLQRDPAGYVDGMGLSEYVRSRPTVLSDARGHCADGAYRELVRHASQSGLPFIVTDIAALDWLRRGSRAAVRARTLAETLYPATDNGPQDAFRHCYWACRMTRDIGPIPADIILDCHEYWNVEAGQRSCVTEMDNHNNDVGQSLAPVGMPVEGVDQACQNACVAAEKSGQLMTSPPCDDPMCPDFPREGIDIAGEND